MASPLLKQSWTVSGVLLNMVGQGMVLSYPSSLLPALNAPDSPIQADMDTKAWIASSVGMAGIPGFLVSSILMDLWGRRIAHALVILPGIIGWCLLYTSTGVPTLLIGRILTGFCAGATVGLGAVVIGEYSSPTYRGSFLNLKTASVCIGGMLVHILGNFLTWRVVALVSLIPQIAALCIIYTWPESPAWLASKKDFDRCEISFLWLRGKDEQAIKELDELIKSQVNQTKVHKTISQKTGDFFKKFTKKDFLKPVFIIITGSVLLEVSGRHLFPAYALDIMGEITGSKTQSFYYTLAIDLIITTSATFSSFLVRIMKRRTLLFGTGGAAIAVLACACTYLFLASRNTISKDHTWIPVSLFVVYFILVNLGCTPIPLSFLGELLPLEHRGVGSMIGGIFISLCVNAGLQVTPFLLMSVKVYGTFAVLGTCMAVLLTILYFVLPETKDKTLQEIESYFKNGKYYDVRLGGDEDEVKMKMLVDISCRKEKMLSST